MVSMASEGFTLVYLLGAGHCGSTLLNLLLNGHSQMLGLSEIETIGRYTELAKETQDNPLRTPFWQGVKQCYEITSGESFTQIDISHPPWRTMRGWNVEDVNEWAQANQYLLSCIARQSGASFLVDASKFWQRAYLLQQSGFFDLKVIHLIRDGQGVMNSYLRKGRSFGASLRRWAASSLWALYLRRKSKDSDWLQVRYEDLAAEPEATLRRICSFLEASFEPDMLAYRHHPDVGIGGNRMRRHQDERIFLDERWKQELSLSHRIGFALLGGWLNKIYGY